MQKTTSPIITLPGRTIKESEFKKAEPEKDREFEFELRFYVPLVHFGVILPSQSLG